MSSSESSSFPALRLLSFARRCFTQSLNFSNHFLNNIPDATVVVYTYGSQLETYSTIWPLSQRSYKVCCIII